MEVFNFKTATDLVTITTSQKLGDSASMNEQCTKISVDILS